MKIVSVIPQENYHLKITFDGNKQQDIDCTPLLSGKMGNELKDYSLFQKAQVDDFGGIYWPNGFDICPDIIENPELLSQTA